MLFENYNYTLPDTDEIVDFIDYGTYSKICIVKHDGEILARKEVKYGRMEDIKIDNTIHEIELLKELKHRNILGLIDSYIDTDKNTIYIYTKYYKKGDLRNFMEEKEKKEEDFSLEVYIFINMLFIGDNQFYERFNKWIAIYSQ